MLGLVLGILCAFLVWYVSLDDAIRLNKKSGWIFYKDVLLRTKQNKLLNIEN